MNTRPNPAPPPTLRQRLIGLPHPALSADPLGDALADIFAMFGVETQAPAESHARPDSTSEDEYAQ